MKLPRPSNEHQRAALKRASAHQVRCAGGQEAAAALTRVGRQTVQTYCSAAPDHADVYMPLDVMLDLTLDAVARDEPPLLLREICALAGGAYVAGPAAAGVATDWGRLLAAIAGQHGEAVAAVCQALADDGQVSADEVRALNIRELLSRVIESLTAMRTRADELMERDA
ncbi:hypothetical protein GWI72_10520 [Microvirga tunisiensis]|uniref:Uncharacterized protein n=1 Tax=Pannonibacter tanglangensis TaxID=2750084 RepID=A0A7X5F4M8_9HYPH|nr:hypothetical protein [Pannonibacter sp. XCT-53]NBN78700.1 hypothetical protein [Pannonibacter sp. XCT-53]